jgi:chemotaxis protein MotB
VRIHSRIALISLVCLSASGCVSNSTYEQKVSEANSLQSSLSGLQEDYQQLTADKQRTDALLVETEDRLTASDADLKRAQKDIVRLEEVLTTRSAEAGAAMTEMRQTINVLELEKRELANQVERERIAREARIAQMKTTYDALVGKLEDEIERGEVTISELQGKLTVNMVERILFDSGKADIKPEGLEVLGRVGDILKDVQDKDIQVEGHTDNVPISSRLRDKFPSNWELSTARAANVVHFLQEQSGISGTRLAVAGFGEHRPISDNSTPEGREENRRIQIVLVPPFGQAQPATE